jgi:hypothetical protein
MSLSLLHRWLALLVGLGRRPESNFLKLAKILQSLGQGSLLFPGAAVVFTGQLSPTRCRMAAWAASIRFCSLMRSSSSVAALHSFRHEMPCVAANVIAPPLPAAYVRQ